VANAIITKIFSLLEHASGGILKYNNIAVTAIDRGEMRSCQKRVSAIVAETLGHPNKIEECNITVLLQDYLQE